MNHQKWAGNVTAKSTVSTVEAERRNHDESSYSQLLMSCRHYKICFEIKVTIVIP